MNAPIGQITIDQKFQKQMRSRFKMSLYMGAKLPLGLFAGLRVDDLDENGCSVSLPYSWRSQNPFRSIYFAAQCMAAEMSTGALAMLAIKSSKRSVSMLVTDMKAEFIKKGTQRTSFRCDAGQDFFKAVSDTIADGEPRTIRAQVQGIMSDGSVISNFEFTWSVKARKTKTG